MAKTNRLYKSVYNQCLEYISGMRKGDNLPAEIALAERFDISRTTIRAVLTHLAEEGIVEWHGRTKRVLRTPRRKDFYQEPETRTTRETVESQFVQWVLGGDLEPGTPINESELSRRFGVSTSAVREFLIRFSRFGLIEKRPNRSWMLSGFTRDFAVELCDLREMFEVRSVRAFVAQPEAHENWTRLARVKAEHEDLIPRIDKDYLEFQKLDEKLHTLLSSAVPNRFINDFNQLIAIVFHYHYRWNMTGERARNKAAAAEHMVLIEALQTGDLRQSLAAAEAHLATARATLLHSMKWDA